ncbi:LAME_0F05270g1_1 [Lachancea meyersii CBS 8951]|uniref:LAME_0F05270g1_1 n=1 Tax=Lachancea meyersii CBS 8951 TaxID=1266667 RepID=A0A1G4JSM5_9SACH|nr:LAME_0F05270g1_1 [Lachancea meyersii CBS 8951]
MEVTSPSNETSSSSPPPIKRVLLMTKVKAECELMIAFIFFSILGNYSRLGLIKLTNYEGSYVRGPTVLWANLAACFLMGLMQTMKSYKVFSPLLFTAITTGYCGCVSSFSSLMVEMFTNAANQPSTRVASGFPNRAYGIMQFLAVLLTQLLASMCSHIFGLYVAKEFALYFKNFENRETSLAARRTHRVVSFIQKATLVLSVPVLAVQIVLAAVYDNRSRYWTLSAIFAFPGAALRYALSKQLNHRLKHFPMGTFTANFAGTLLLAVFTLVTKGKRSDNSPIIKSATAKTVVIALGNGFCGSLTTVSTFINECHLLPLRKTLFYYFVSIFLSFGIVVVIVGSCAWTRGLNA